MTEFHTRLQGKFTPIQKIMLQGQTPAEVKAQVDLETKIVAELLALDIYDNKDVRFLRSITLTRFCSEQRWWFMSCTKCHKTSQAYGTTYKCIDPNCPCIDATPRYRICFTGADDTNEAEFVLFDRAGKGIVGKSLITLLRDGKSSHAPLAEIVRVAREDETIPRELVALVGQKYRFVVSISTKSFLPEKKTTSFQVNRIDVPSDKGVRNAVLYRKADPSTQHGGHSDSLSGQSTSISTEVAPAGSNPPLLMGSQPNDNIAMESLPTDPLTPKGQAIKSSPASVTKGKDKPTSSSTGKTPPLSRKPLFPNVAIEPTKNQPDLTKVSSDETVADLSESTKDLPGKNDGLPPSKKTKL